MAINSWKANIAIMKVKLRRCLHWDDGGHKNKNSGDDGVDMMMFRVVI